MKDEITKIKISKKQASKGPTTIPGGKLSSDVIAYVIMVTPWVSLAASIASSLGSLPLVKPYKAIALSLSFKSGGST